MARTLAPRPYQQEAVQAFLSMLEETREHPVIAMPTGTGKGLVIALICERVLKQFPSARITVAVHSKELVSQNSKAMLKLWPQAPIGIFSAGLKTKQAAMPITFCSIQSAVKAAPMFGVQHLLLIDEAHALSPQETSNYQKLIATMRAFNPAIRIGGLSATPYRRKMGLITELGIFTEFCYDITGLDDFNKLLDEGYLKHLVAKPPSFQFDVSKVKVTAGEYNQKELHVVVNDETKTERAVQESMQVLHDRNHILVFCSGIDHVENVTQMLTSWGERAGCVHSKVGSEERDRVIESFLLPGPNNIRWLVNDNICSTGFDSPWIDGIVDLSPTTSPGLHVQKLGRGTRPYFFNEMGVAMETLIDPDTISRYELNTNGGRLNAIADSASPNCRVLDFAGNIPRLGPVNDPQIPKRIVGKKTGELPIKICPACGAYNFAAARFCANVTEHPPCTHEFEFKSKLDGTAGTDEIIRRKVEPVAKEMAWFAVSRIEYDRLVRPFQPPEMQVKYFCGVRRFTDLVSIEHGGWAHKKAVAWWAERLPGYPPPPKTSEGLTATAMLRQPTHVYVHINNVSSKSNKVWPRITAYSYDGTTPEFTVEKEPIDGGAS